MAQRGTPEKKAKELFLEALRDGLPVIDAADLSGRGRRTLYRWRQLDRDFAAAWDEAYDAGADMLEQEAQRRAVEGVLEPVMYQGEVVERVRKYSDTLLIFLLKARRPKRFADFSEMRVTGQNGGPLKVEHDAPTAARLLAGLVDAGLVRPPDAGVADAEGQPVLPAPAD